MFESLGFETLTPRSAALIFGLVLGAAFGALAEVSAFCFRRGIVTGPDRRTALATWVLALAVAVLATQAAVGFGLIDFSAHPSIGEFDDLTVANDANGDAVISYTWVPPDGGFANGSGPITSTITLFGIDMSSVDQGDFLNREQAIEELLTLGVSAHAPTGEGDEEMTDSLFTQAVNDQQDPASYQDDP